MKHIAGKCNPAVHTDYNSKSVEVISKLRFIRDEAISNSPRGSFLEIERIKSRSGSFTSYKLQNFTFLYEILNCENIKFVKSAK
jgi:hypothetical protein